MQLQINPSVQQSYKWSGILNSKPQATEWMPTNFQRDDKTMNWIFLSRFNGAHGLKANEASVRQQNGKR